MPNLETALALARDGYSIFPCHAEGPETKRPLPSVFWGQQSTTDTKRISAWWNRCPSPIIGLDVKKSGLIIIDLDGQCGAEDWQDLLADHPDPQAPIVTTPNGGQHIWFRQRPGEARGNGRGSMPKKRRNDETGKMEGIDVRGAGGYVIAPGSILADGRKYELHGDLKSIPVLPDWLADLLDPHSAAPVPAPTVQRPSDGSRERAYIDAALEAECSEIARAGKGARNETANTSAFRIGQLVGKHLSESEALAALEQAAGAWGVPANDKVFGPRGTLARALRAGMAAPRTIPEQDAYSSADVDTFIRNLVERDGHLIDQDTGEIVGEPAPVRGPSTIFGGIKSITPSSTWYDPPGILGEIADWICATARRPNRPLAVAAATAVLSTVCGRHLYSPTISTLNLYIIAMASTAVGKGRPLSAAGELLTAARLERLHTTLKAFSVSALEQIITATPCCLATADEIGANLLQRMSNKKANPNEIGMRAILLELWSRELGQTPFSTTARAGGSQQLVYSPSMSIFGASTPEAFYDSLTTGSVKDGFMNRFLLAPAAPRARAQDVDAAGRRPPDSIVAKLLALIPQIRGNLSEPLGIFSGLTELSPDDATVVPWANPAIRAKANELEEELLDIMETMPSEHSALAGRVFEMSVRLATLHAISRSGRKAVVTEQDLSWGLGWSIESVDAMIEGARKHMSDNEHQEAYSRVLSLIEERGTISHSDMLIRLKGKVNAFMLKGIMEMLLTSGQVAIPKPETTEKGGRPKTIYHYVRKAG